MHNAGMNKKGINVSYIIKLFIIALPVIWGFYIVKRYGVNICFWDEWTYIDNRDNFFTLDYLWTQHNEHRMFFPKIVTYFIGQLFSWNSKAFMYTSQLFLLFLYIVVILILIGKKKNLTWVKTVEIFLIGMCVYNTCQYENLLWGFQIAWFMIVSLGAVSFYFFNKYIENGRLKYLILSLALAVIVSFCSLHGLAIWGAYTVLLIAMQISGEKIPRASLVSTTIIAFCSFLAYFKGYHSVEGHKQFLGQSVGQILSYYVGQIGATLLSDQVVFCYLLGFITFFIAVLTGIYFLIKKNIKSHIKSLGPMIMSCGAMFITAIGRGGGGTGESVASRYTTNGMLFIAFFLVVGFEIVNAYLLDETNKIQNHETSYIGALRNTLVNIFMILTMVLPVFILIRNVDLLNAVNSCYVSRMHSKIEMVNQETLSVEDMQTLYPVDANTMPHYLENIDYLKENHLNAFCEDVNELLFCKEDLPETINSEQLSDSIFTVDNVSVTDSKVVVSINQFEEIETKHLSDCRFYLSINNNSYHMVLDSDRVRFEKILPEFEEGTNELQFIIIKDNTLYYSRNICLFKDGENIQVVNGIQKDNSILKGYTEINDNRVYCVDTINDVPPSVENILHNNEAATISGWIKVDDTSNKTCYLRIGDAFFELQWNYRQDVVDAFGDTGYSGFQGTFLPLSISLGNQNSAIVITDNSNKTYVETELNCPLIIQ